MVTGLDLSILTHDSAELFYPLLNPHQRMHVLHVLQRRTSHPPPKAAPAAAQKAAVPCVALRLWWHGCCRWWATWRYGSSSTWKWPPSGSSNDATSCKSSSTRASARPSPKAATSRGKAAQRRTKTWASLGRRLRMPRLNTFGKSPRLKLSLVGSLCLVHTSWWGFTQWIWLYRGELAGRTPSFACGSVQQPGQVRRSRAAGCCVSGPGQIHACQVGVSLVLDNYCILVCFLTLFCVLRDSSEFCEDHLQLLFTILERSPHAVIRANTIIAMGDLTFRFPNLIEPWTPNLYARCLSCSQTHS